MPINNLLGTGLDATSNPDPNTLGTVNPLDNPNDFETPSAAWTSQGNEAIFMTRALMDTTEEKPLRVAYIPSSAGATFDITVWFFHPPSGTWIQPQNNATVSYTGAKVDFVNNPDKLPVFLEISNVSAGTLSIYFGIVGEAL